MLIFGMTPSYFLVWFFLFSFFGYLLECVVLTVENKHVIYNRGFAKGPFCVIYGFGAVGAYLVLRPLVGNLPLLFICSSLLATSMEFITAHVMIRLFGSFWWDYSSKHFNYKGMICLQSSIGWGFLGIFFFYFLDGWMHRMVGLIPMRVQSLLAILITVCYLIDFTSCLYRRIRYPEEEQESVGRLYVDK